MTRSPKPRKRTWAERRFAPGLLAEIDKQFDALVNSPRPSRKLCEFCWSGHGHHAEWCKRPLGARR